jgi:hypothetical protein
MAAPSKSRPKLQSQQGPKLTSYRFNGQNQPAQFSEGVEAFRVFIEAAVQDEGIPLDLDDLEFAEKHALDIQRQFIATSPPFSLGYAAALADWLAISRHSEVPAGTWEPLHEAPRVAAVQQPTVTSLHPTAAENDERCQVALEATWQTACLFDELVEFAARMDHADTLQECAVLRALATRGQQLSQLTMRMLGERQDSAQCAEEQREVINAGAAMTEAANG